MPFTSETARKAGAKGKRGPSKASPAFIEFMKGEGADLAMKYLKELKGVEYIENYARLAPYALAKLQAIAIQAEHNFVGPSPIVFGDTSKKEDAE